MSDKIKKEFHYFLLTDYDKEEEFLRKRHKEGWKFLQVKLPGIYYFEKCGAEDVVYRLDFNPQNPSEKQKYIRMFEDYGWEYLQDMNEYSYFRKAAKKGAEKDTEIFSDNESRLAMLKRIFNKRMVPILIVFLLCVFPQVIKMLEMEVVSGFDIAFLAVFGAMFAVYLGIVGWCMC